MNRAFIVQMDLDPSADPNIIARELMETVSGDFPETISVRPWASPGEAQSGPNPIEGSMFLGQNPFPT